jgi:hypothetical protein
VRLRAIGEHVAQVGKLRIAILLDELGDVVAAKPAAWLALDREGWDEEVRERVGVVSHASGRPGPDAPAKSFTKYREYIDAERGESGDQGAVSPGAGPGPYLRASPPSSRWYGKGRLSSEGGLLRPASKP